MEVQEMRRLHANIGEFADTFAPDAIDALEAAVDEALFTAWAELTPTQRLYVKERCIAAVAYRFHCRQTHLDQERYAMDIAEARRG